MNEVGIPEGAVLVSDAYERFWWGRWNGAPPPTADLMDGRWLDRLGEEEDRRVSRAFAKVNDIDESAFINALIHRDLELLYRDDATGDILQAPTRELWAQPGNRWLLHNPVVAASAADPLARIDGQTLFVWDADLRAFLERERAFLADAEKPPKPHRLISSALACFVSAGGMSQEFAENYAQKVGLQGFDEAQPIMSWSEDSLHVDAAKHWERPTPPTAQAPALVGLQSSPLTPHSASPIALSLREPDRPQAKTSSGETAPGGMETRPATIANAPPEKGLGTQSLAIIDWFSSRGGISDATLKAAKGHGSWEALALKIEKETGLQVNSEGLKQFRRTMVSRGLLSSPPRNSPKTPD